MFALSEDDFAEEAPDNVPPKEESSMPAYGSAEYSVEEGGDTADTPRETTDETEEERELKWYHKVGNYMKARYNDIQDFVETVGERTFGDVRGLTGNVGAGIGAYVGVHIGGAPGLLIGLGLGALTGAYIGKFLKKELGGSEFDIILDNLNKADHADVTGALKKIRTTVQAKEGDWATRLDRLKDTMSNLYTNLDSELGSMPEHEAKNYILDVSSALNYVEKAYISLKAESEELKGVERTKGYSFEENVDTFKELYSDVGERPPSALLTTIDGVKDVGYKNIAQNLTDLSGLLYQGRSGSTYHNWRTRMEYLKGGMEGMGKNMQAAIDDMEGHEKDVKKLYLDVSTALNVMSKSYIDKRDLASVRYAERSTGYNFEVSAKEFRDTYGEAVGEINLDMF